MMVGYYNDVQMYDYNPEKAKELLKQAGLQTPYDITDGTFIYGENELHVQVIAQNLADIGINIQLDKRDTSTVETAQFNGDFSLSLSGQGSYGNDLGHLSQIFYSDKIGTGLNWAHYRNSEVDKMFLDYIQDVSDGRKEKAHKLLEYIQDESPYALLFEQGEIFVYEEKLHCPMFTDGIYFFMNWYWTK